MMLRDITQADYSKILALNLAYEEMLSPLDKAELQEILDESFYARCSDDVSAFLIAIGEGADYDSPNYHWLMTRYSGLIYIDRIVVAGTAHGTGLGWQLYEELFAKARRSGATHIGCEVNISPPNPGSHAFHQRLGFSRVGEATLSGGKEVAYYLHNLS
jgi:hypothetical protein